MKSDAKHTVSLYRAMLTYQVLFLLIVILLVNLGIVLFLKKEVGAYSGEELAKRNTLLQLTLQDAFRPDLPPPAGNIPAGDAPPPPEREFGGGMIIEELDSRIQRACLLSRTRFTVISAEGEVRFDSDYPAKDMANQIGMPEIIPLIEGEESGLAVRQEAPDRDEEIFQALPLIGMGGELLGFTRVSQPFPLVEHLHNRIIQSVRISNVLSFFIMLLILLPLMKGMVSLIGKLERSALEISRGNFDNDLPSSRGGCASGRTIP